jgi:hypothetical protein
MKLNFKPIQKTFNSLFFVKILFLVQILFTGACSSNESITEISTKGDFSYATNSVTFTSGAVAAASATPIFVGTPGQYSTISALPSGVKLDAITGVISWSGNIAQGVYPIIVKNSNGIKEVTFTLTVNAAIVVTVPGVFPLDYEAAGNIWVDFDGGVATILPNPAAFLPNTSSKVVRIVKNGGQSWAGSKQLMERNIDFSTKKGFTMDVYSPKIGTKVLLKLENETNNGINFEANSVTTKANSWETLTFNCSTINTANTYKYVVVIFDLGTIGDGSANSTYYFDNINQSTIVVPPLSNLTQISLPVTFDSTTIDYTVVDFGGNSSALVVDPAGGNNKVIKTIKGNETWSGTTIGRSSTPGVVTDGFSAAIATNAAIAPKLTVRVYSPSAGIYVRLKIEDKLDVTHTCETEAITTVANGWETLTFNFANFATRGGATEAFHTNYTYNKASIFFNFGNATPGGIYYWDDIIKL